MHCFSLQAMVIDCLLHDGAGPVWEDETVSEVNIDDVFAACDINQDGKSIDNN